MADQQRPEISGFPIVIMPLRLADGTDDGR